MLQYYRLLNDCFDLIICNMILHVIIALHVIRYYVRDARAVLDLRGWDAFPFWCFWGLYISGDKEGELFAAEGIVLLGICSAFDGHVDDVTELVGINLVGYAVLGIL